MNCPQCSLFEPLWPTALNERRLVESCDKAQPGSVWLEHVVLALICTESNCGLIWRDGQARPGLRRLYQSRMRVHGTHWLVIIRELGEECRRAQEPVYVTPPQPRDRLADSWQNVAMTSKLEGSVFGIRYAPSPLFSLSANHPICNLLPRWQSWNSLLALLQQISTPCLTVQSFENGCFHSGSCTSAAVDMVGPL